MSKRSIRKRRHIVEAARAADREANRAAMQECVLQMAQSLRREIDAKLLYMGQMAAQALPKTRPLGLLRGTVPPGQSPKLELGDFFGVKLDPGGIHCTIEEIDAAAGPSWE